MFKKIALVIGLAQLWIIIVSTISWQILPLQPSYLGAPVSTYQKNPYLFSRANFDGYHYLSIAQNGYGYAQQAFFPLYPNLIRASSFIFNYPIWIGIFISLSSFIFGSYILYKLLSLDYSPNTALWSVISLIIFPTSFFFSFVYTEGLFFLLLVLSIYLSRQDKWFLAGMVGILASYCRLVGIFLVPILFLELYQQKKLSLNRILFILLPLIGLGYYMYQLQISTGDWLAFLHAQVLFHQGRSTQIVLLPQVLWRYLQMVLTVDRNLPLYLTILLELIAGLVFGILSLLSWKKLRYSYAFLATAFYLIPTLTGTFTSLPRYILVAFPFFIIFGKLFTVADSRVKLLYCVGVGILSFVCISLFVSGFWLA